jgi:RecA-family ATPase
LERLQEARKTGTLILAEGESDVWTLWFHRFGALGLPGAESLEDTKPRLQERLRQLLASCTASPTGVEFALAWPRLDQGGLTQLEEYIQEHPQVRAIIIDTWALLAPYAKSGGRSQYEGEYAALSPLKHLADTHHLAIVLVHHLRKAGAQDILDEITGSSGMVGTVDTILVLKRERGQNRATLYATGRDLPQERFLTLTFEQASGQWLLDETAGQQRTQE